MRVAGIGVEDVVSGTAFLCRLPGFLRHPRSAGEALAVVRQRMDTRIDGFLAAVGATVYEWPESPYRPLLRRAGCELGDLERLARQAGVEGALRRLVADGVYLTVAEFKGRCDVRRGTLAYRVGVGAFRNPRTAAHLPGQSSGSRGGRTPAPLDLAFVRARVPNYAVVAARLLPARTTHAVWKMPGGDVLDNILVFAGFGALPERWFLQVDARTPGLHPAYRWSQHALRVGARLAGRRLPPPEVVTLEDPLPIARWMAAGLAHGQPPHVQLFSSAALRLCEAARSAGLELRGASLMVGGEPLTPARARALAAAGVSTVPRYGTAEAPSIGLGCRASAVADTVHVLADLYAVIPATDRADPAAMPPDALLVTSLSAASPLVLLNVSLGDRAEVVDGPCGCPLDGLEWAPRLHTIRSFEKLTAGGVTFLDMDVVRVLEEVLPARFGGSPVDYQLLETETADGHPTVHLLVHPRVPLPEPEAVRRVFLETISAGNGAGRLMGRLWADGGFLRVERRVPLATASGKILHLRSARAPGAPGE